MLRNRVARSASRGTRSLFAVLFLPAVLCSLESTAQKTGSGNGARIVVRETRKDAGPVPKGETIRVSFPVKNEGTADLSITDVRVSCGCTVSTFDRLIRPGGEGKVDLAIETRTFQGPISKTAVLVSNDAANPQVTLTVNAVVRPFVEVAPPAFLRIQTLAGVPASTSVILFSSDPSFSPSQASPPSSGSLSAVLERAGETEKVPGKNPNQWKLTLSSAEGSPEGILGGSVKVSTGIQKQPEIEVPVAGFIRPTLSVSANFLNFGNFEFKGQLVEREVILTNNDPKNISFAVTRADVSGAEATAEIVKADANRFRVLLRMNSKQKKGEFEGTLKISTNDPEKSEIRIPFQGMVF